MKKAQFLPLFKKKDPLNKENCRPVSVLPTISKILRAACTTSYLRSWMNILIHSLLLLGKGLDVSPPC